MSNKVDPLKPQDVAKEKQASIPDEVLECFNQVILEEYYNGYASIKQEDVVNLMISKGLDRNEIFKKGWLNVEDIYRKAGWKVEYDKPAYNESYPASFSFSAKNR